MAPPRLAAGKQTNLCKAAARQLHIIMKYQIAEAALLTIGLASTGSHREISLVLWPTIRVGSRLRG